MWDDITLTAWVQTECDVIHACHRAGEPRGGCVVGASVYSCAGEGDSGARGRGESLGTRLVGGECHCNKHRNHQFKKC